MSFEEAGEERAAPTVIVSRRPRAGHEDRFRRWNDELQRAASEFAGYLGSEAQPPGEAHPDEWVTMYRFDSQPHLDAWLESPRRRELMMLGEPLLEGSTREQRVARPSDGGSAVTAVMSQRIPADRMDQFRSAEAQIAQAMSRFPGFISLEHSEPVPGVQDDYVISFTFASRVDLDRWLQSAERRQVLELVEPLIEGERTMNVLHGFGGWFMSRDERPPPRWKQAVAVLIALYPTTLSLGWLQRTFAPDVPWIPGLFVSNVLGIAALTWVLMPALTKRLDVWLNR